MLEFMKLHTVSALRISSRGQCRKISTRSSSGKKWKWLGGLSSDIKECERIKECGTASDMAAIRGG